MRKGRLYGRVRGSFELWEIKEWHAFPEISLMTDRKGWKYKMLERIWGH